MKTMNKVSDEQMEEALANEEYQKIMSKASKKYFGILNFDEIESCKLTALWKAISRYDENATNKKNKKSKFTSFLYRGVELECKTASKFIAVGRKMQEPLHDNIGLDSSVIESIELMDEIMRVEHGNVIRDIFYGGLTIKELASKLGVSKQIIAVRKKRALKSLKARLE